MKTLTLYEPWATWIALGYKTIETRGHSRFCGLKGQIIAIHAGKSFDGEATRTAAPYYRSDWPLETWATRGSPGKIVCVARVVAVRWLREEDSQAALCPTHGDRYGLILADVLRLVSPIPASGWQGPWNWTPPANLNALCMEATA